MPTKIGRAGLTPDKGDKRFIRFLNETFPEDTVTITYLGLNLSTEQQEQFIIRNNIHPQLMSRYNKESGYIIYI